MTSKLLSRLALAAMLALAVASAPSAFAQRGGGGFHGGGGGFHGGGSFHSAGGVHGGGFRGGPRYGGYGGWRGGYYGYGGYGYGGYGLGLGWLGFGLTFATLPFYYNTYWWDGVPYYYSNDNYYQWDRDVNAYETVQPPQGLAAEVAASPPAQVDDQSVELYAYPRNGQSAAQQTRDRDECKQWAVGQAGSDPAKHAGYLRAEEACLTGRGYSVR